VSNKIKRAQSLGEEIANAISHGIMAIFGICVFIACLIYNHND
jgi:hemolysin III